MVKKTGDSSNGYKGICSNYIHLIVAFVFDTIFQTSLFDAENDELGEIFVIKNYLFLHAKVQTYAHGRSRCVAVVIIQCVNPKSIHGTITRGQSSRTHAVSKADG